MFRSFHARLAEPDFAPLAVLCEPYGKAPRPIPPPPGLLLRLGLIREKKFFIQAFGGKQDRLADCIY
jgi:hypothetical protein